MTAAPQLARGEAAEATRELYERYAEPIFRFCLVQLESREEAEDALQSTFLNAFRGLKRGVRPASESAWLYKIAHNICLTRRRSTLRRGRVETPKDLDAFAATVPAPAPGGVDELIALGEALESMPGSQQRAILLREWQGLSYREIGEQMGLSQGAVETLIFRARRSLADRLERPARPRIRRALDAGWLVAAVKGLLGAGAATKAVATATVATAVVLTVGPLTEPQEAVPKRAASAPERVVAALAPARLRHAPVADDAVRLERRLAARVRSGRAGPPARAKRLVATAARPKPVAAPPPAAKAAPVAPERAEVRPSRPAAKPKPARGERTRPAEPQKERRAKPAAPAPAAAKEKAKGLPEVRGRGRSDEAKEPGSNKPPVPPAPAAERVPPAAVAADAAPTSPPAAAAADAARASPPAGHGDAGGNDKEKDKGPTG